MSARMARAAASMRGHGGRAGGVFGAGGERGGVHGGRAVQPGEWVVFGG